MIMLTFDWYGLLTYAGLIGIRDVLQLLLMPMIVGTEMYFSINYQLYGKMRRQLRQR